MTIYFAAARNRGYAAIAKALSPTVQLSHANDNTGNISRNPVMRGALELFAEHGFGAAREACDRAQAAASDRDHHDCRHWLSVCRMFDRRLASSWASRLGIALSA